MESDDDSNLKFKPEENNPEEVPSEESVDASHHSTNSSSDAFKFSSEENIPSKESVDTSHHTTDSSYDNLRDIKAPSEESVEVFHQIASLSSDDLKDKSEESKDKILAAVTSEEYAETVCHQSSSSSEAESYTSETKESKEEIPFELSRKRRPIFINIDWPSIEEFDHHMGFKKISQLIKAWKVDSYWKYCIDFLALVKGISSNYYFYEVKWSIPYKAFPIPAVTASMYFRIEASQVKPSSYPVEVTYTYEGFHYTHVPGKINFDERWLAEMILFKLTFFPTIDF